MSGENIHSGHRERLKKEYLASGISPMSEVRALELLLFYAIPRADTNPLAHALIKRFGSLNGVLSATSEELKSVDGVGDSTACLIKLSADISRKALEAERESKQKRQSLSDSLAAGQLIYPYFLNRREEAFMMFMLDPKNKLIKAETISQGVVNSVNVEIRRCVETALFDHASSVIIAHNHPDGDMTPSGEDIALTSKIKDALSVVGIVLADHFIVAGSSWYSFADHSLL